LAVVVGLRYPACAVVVCGGGKQLCGLLVGEVECKCSVVDFVYDAGECVCGGGW